MGKTKIEWTAGDDGTYGAVWNPIRGCSRISEGCRNCYAERIAARFSKPGLPFHGFAEMTPSGPRWTGKVAGVRAHLEDPLRWMEPKRIFVNSMSDLFHEDLPDHEILNVFSVMEAAKSRGHIFQVLTKRAGRMREWVSKHADWVDRAAGAGEYLRRYSHVHLGVSVEDWGSSEERIPFLMSTPAAVRFLSCEPLLAPLALARHFRVATIEVEDRPFVDDKGIGYPAKCVEVAPLIHWVIVGGESGPGARPCRVGWIRSIVAQCRKAAVPVFVKQLGAHIIDRNDAGFDGSEPDNWPDGTETDRWDLDPGRQYQGADARILLASTKGGDMAEWPEDLRVREFPSVRT